MVRWRPLLPHPQPGSRRSLFAFPSRRLSTVTLNDDSLTIPSLGNATFPYIWLRDSCQSTECIHPETTQKLHSSTDFASRSIDEGLHIEWPNGHVSLFPKSFLERHSSKDSLSRFRKDVGAETWDRKDVEKSRDLFLKYEDFKKPGGLLKAIDQLCKSGLLFLVPRCPTSTTNSEAHLTELALEFATEIRETFYGRIFHVQNRNSENIAYTNLKLGLHMDMLYLENPPRYQILNCIRNKVIGGSSVFSDSFHAARQLKSLNPEDYELLTRVPVPFQYLYGDHHLHYSRPTIALDPYNPTLESPPIKYVNYGPPFQAPLLLSPSSASALQDLYRALGRFADLLNSPENTYEYTLQEGDAVIFDNRRVSHARTAFRDYDDSKEGTFEGPRRWLQGCYFEGDSMLDRGRVLRAGGRF
ncbi:Clavaminate synthase-like protein [Gymnopus androsaceus JB14]|uniref:Clavaminate synthase-like protein n=1 Tax=Gymnopus androsaceus JB14 TaxID=1447944 RepID=A0A6A4I277_9AGAR|nr:Clavaminate synthase-like protein [Gymnopus androsaceus JB14]